MEEDLEVAEAVEVEEVEEVVEVVDGETTWRFDAAFLRSRWTCIWGRGCLGILPEPAEHLGQGCCSLGAELDEEEGPFVSAMAALVPEHLFQHHEQAVEGGVFADASCTATRVVDGACIFLNRPGFGGGAGCALHVAALDAGDPPMDWKPSVCWQLPVHVDFSARGDGGEVAEVRRWTRADWGPDGERMHWCCTEDGRAEVGDAPVVDALADVLEAMTSTEVVVELRRRLAT